MQDRNERLVDIYVDREKRNINRQSVLSSMNKLRASEQQKKQDRADARLRHEIDVYRNAEHEFDRSPITDVPDEVKVSDFYLDDVSNKREYNTTYANYYWQRYEDTNLEKYAKVSQRILTCNKFWFGDRYKNTGVFNVKRVFHCENRWCWFCNHLKQAKRLYKYTLRFESLLKQYDLYHIVFTVKNVKGKELKGSLERMHNTMNKLIRYFQGFGKIKGIDFTQYGFVGAVRSFEIVINPRDYHPHIHCLFLFKKGLNLDTPKTIINKFSFNGSVLTRKYSKFEILMQKLFYLSYHGQKLNMKNIEALKIGYSCTVDHIEEDSTKWHEVFKYATKMSKDGASSCTYEQFVLLDDILRRMKMIQGYGIFYGADDDDPETDPLAEILFEKVLILLNRKEKPERDVSMELNEIVDEVHRKSLTVISKKLSYKYLKAMYDEFRAESTVEDGFEPF